MGARFGVEMLASSPATATSSSSSTQTTTWSRTQSPRWSPRGGPGRQRSSIGLQWSTAAGRTIESVPRAICASRAATSCPCCSPQGEVPDRVMSGNAFAREVLQHIFPHPRGRIPHLGRRLPGHPRALFGPCCRSRAAGAFTACTTRTPGRGASPRLPSASALAAADVNRYRALSTKAAELGLRPPDDPGMHDWLHWRTASARFASTLAGHPLKPDRRASLGLRGSRRAGAMEP